ncbi:uncharacterized protein [Heterodontus francisci]|uniref:uncharacterized protein n=1 Tax=Heterodontus francisci TaxID=7792 RepID=UPI00355C5E3A
MILSIVTTFLGREDLSLSDLKNLTKARLKELAAKLELELKPGAKKADMMEVIAQHLKVEEEKGNPDDNSVELARIQLQMKQLEQKRELEMKTLELKQEKEMKKLELQREKKKGRRENKKKQEKEKKKKGSKKEYSN